MAKKKSKNPMGRPRFEVTPEVIKSAEQFMAQGLTREQCAANLGISRSKFFEIQEQNVDFLDAIKKGEARGIGDVTNALFENATVKKDNTAIIFYLKNRAGWVDKSETKIQEEKTITLDLTRIGINELSAIERAFEQSHLGASQGREISAQSQGVYEGSLADD
tara:strand:- start:200 stop:688 length:489 start_codon:yes stop_codon:yes gene_type:complete